MQQTARALTINVIASLSSFLIFFSSFFISFDHPLLLLLAVAFLGIGISAAIHNAAIIAARVGPSLGTLILALSVTVIEVALILSLMNNDSADSTTIARDTVFAAIMIVTNGIIGVCILVGGIRFKELGFQAVGTTSLLGVLVVLTMMTLVLPNFTTSTHGPTYGPEQLIFISITSIVLYGALIWAQTKSHKSYFEPVSDEEKKFRHSSSPIPSLSQSWLSFLGLLLSLIAVVGLAKLLSPTIESTLVLVGAPKAVVGVVVALLVLAPETFAAVHAANTNKLQTSLNLALGSGAASIALTIPAVSVYSLVAHKSLNLGLDPKGMIFLFTTFISGCFTFGAGSTTPLHGIIHLIILVSYIGMVFMP